MWFGLCPIDAQFAVNVTQATASSSRLDTGTVDYGIQFSRQSKQANVTRSVWRNVEGDTKTEVSCEQLPLHPVVIEELKQWKSATLYGAGDCYVFPSVAKNGSQPISPDMILSRRIRPALDRIGVKKRIGWHGFRHGLATMPRQIGVDIKTAQEMLRHANSRITADIYQQCVSEEKRKAQDLVFGGLLEGSSTQPPRRGHERSSRYIKPFIIFCLWRGRRGSNPRPLPLDCRALVHL